MKIKIQFGLISIMLATLPLNTVAKTYNEDANDNIIKNQRTALIENTLNKGFGPQSPRNIDNNMGENTVIFSNAPASSQMNLCNIHFHKNAEHAGGEFNKYAGNGDGFGYESGFVYSGTLSKSESESTETAICPSKHSSLSTGDTIEVHYVHTTAKIKPGPTLGSCLSESIKNPQLRVETQVYVLVNDNKALDFNELSKVKSVNSYYQALNIPNNTGKPVVYSGSTTGSGYNEAGSPFQVTWSVRPHVAKVNAQSVAKWCKSNVFNEEHAHGVRNLIINPALLSEIK